MKSKEIALGVLSGVAAATFIGLLFVPESIIRKRRRVLVRVKNHAVDLEEILEDFMERLTDKYEHIRKDALQMVSKSNAG